jgi:hypothetical protein
MAKRRNCGTYGDNLAQGLNKIRVTKKMVVHKVAITFMRKLFLKFASFSDIQTFRIHVKKNNTTGNIINRYLNQMFISCLCVKNKYIRKVAPRKRHILKINVPRFPTR